MRGSLLPVLLGSLALALSVAPSRADGVQAGSGVSVDGAAAGPSCQDPGSWAVVDGPARLPRNAPIRAESWGSCADLPSTAPKIPMFVDVQVGGNGNLGTGNGTGTGNGSGGPVTLPAPWPNRGPYRGFQPGRY